MTQGARWLQRVQTGFWQQQIDVAVQQTAEAKRTFAAQNSDNENALAAYDEADAETREQTLMDCGLMTDRTALCLRDPGALSVPPRGHTPAELDAIAKEARIQSGRVVVAMR